MVINLRDFSIYIDADRFGRIGPEQRVQLNYMIDALTNWRINIIWLIDSKKLHCCQVFNTIKNIHRCSKEKSVIIHGEILTSENCTSLFARLLLKHLPFELLQDKRIAPTDYAEICGSGTPKGCTFSSCLGNTVYIKSDATLTICPRSTAVSLCPIKKGETIEHVFETESFKSVLIEHIKKRENCKKDCLYYTACHGGCPLTMTRNECEIKQAVEIKRKTMSTEEIYNQRISKLADLYRG